MPCRQRKRPQASPRSRRRPWCPARRRHRDSHAPPRRRPQPRHSKHPLGPIIALAWRHREATCPRQVFGPTPTTQITPKPPGRPRAAPRQPATSSSRRRPPCRRRSRMNGYVTCVAMSTSRAARSATSWFAKHYTAFPVLTGRAALRRHRQRRLLRRHQLDRYPLTFRAKAGVFTTNRQFSGMPMATAYNHPQAARRPPRRWRRPPCRRSLLHSTTTVPRPPLRDDH